MPTISQNLLDSNITLVQLMLTLTGSLGSGTDSSHRARHEQGEQLHGSLGERITRKWATATSVPRPSLAAAGAADKGAN